MGATLSTLPATTKSNNDSRGAPFSTSASPLIDSSANLSSDLHTAYAEKKSFDFDGAKHFSSSLAWSPDGCSLAYSIAYKSRNLFNIGQALHAKERAMHTKKVSLENFLSNIPTASLAISNTQKDRVAIYNFA